MLTTDNTGGQAHGLPFKRNLPPGAGFALLEWSMKINMYFIENRKYLMYINLFALAIIYLQSMIDTNNWGKNIHEV